MPVRRGERQWSIRIKSPKRFAKSSLRTIPTHAKEFGKKYGAIVGCPVGKWDKKIQWCKVGMQVQAILLKKGLKGEALKKETKKWKQRLFGKRRAKPAKRRQAPAKRKVRKPARRRPRRGGAAKHKKARRNPDLMIINPGRTLQDSKGFRQALKTYKDFHGNEPKEIVMERTDDGKKKVTRQWKVSLGEIPEDMYSPQSHSKKAGVPFVHEWEKKIPGWPKHPLLTTSAEGRGLSHFPSSIRVTPQGITG